MVNPKFLQKFYEQFETADLLRAVDHVDTLRKELSDGEDLRPPIIRQELLELHQLAMDVSHRDDVSKAKAMFELAFGIGNRLFTIEESLRAIEKTLQALTDLAVDFDDGYDEED